MKITEQQLKQLIKEELNKALSESSDDRDKQLKQLDLHRVSVLKIFASLRRIMLIYEKAKKEKSIDVPFWISRLRKDLRKLEKAVNEYYPYPGPIPLGTLTRTPILFRNGVPGLVPVEKEDMW
jgi:hypothetical protein